ncbi:hypothetical protein P153DRAFT_364652 [Dothidotthia symphoricarpi CBS 119687]|uniref:Elongator complex protein 6 n=1 Tax=Dothidotthia symphoricarpi CBS 119687 TaxID=1392245 RepID=A0A6A6AMA7_9PLEO|nr:uncharacterized protein P153DRAFT_364652 [Dothidotthia symphoricarpi CBS 119687]KAF2132225.1 hypothetical protein P153DRAFT_364652 [Dothidotthia symphoricarpi CBS 119687]
MPPSTRIPPFLHRHIHLPHDESILLLTSTLGASANWLIIRFLCDALSNSTQDGGAELGHNVVLVSWMREYEFWRQEARKGAGLDLERLKKEGRFAFVDGLSGVLGEVDEHNNARPEIQPRAAAPSASTSGIQAQRGGQTLPVRGPPGRVLPARGAQPATSTTLAAQTATTSKSTPGHCTLKSSELGNLKTAIASAVSSLSSSSTPTSPSQRKTLLVLDNPDLLLALNSTMTPSAMTSLVLALHTLPSVSHMLLHIQSDNPLLSLSVPPQPLELAHHNFLIRCAHMSRRILGVRVLDTGVARDVSGVIRVTEQKVGWLGLGLEDEQKDEGESSKGKEFLYQVKGDGSVKVFERGAGGEG